VNSKKKPDAGNRSAAEEKRFLIVVDGNPSDLFSTGKVLQRLDYIIFTAGSAEDGLQFLQMARPAAIVTELLLPKMSGMDLLNRIKQDPATKNIPVIIHTHMKDPKVEELCLVAGCASYLRKPVEPNTLYRSIQYAIEATPRHYVRFKTCLPVLIGDEKEGSSVDECVTALSENGVYVRTLRSCPVNSVVPVTVFFTGRQVTVRAMVLYCITGAGGPLKEPGMGMKFIDISDADRAFIRTFIKRELTKDFRR
jgi:CheY-like chemotaxis protein